MYQTRHPYTGMGTINLGPRETSTLGLGVDTAVPVAGAPGVVAIHSPTAGSPGTSTANAYHPKVVRFLRQHTRLRSVLQGIKARKMGTPTGGSTGGGSLGDVTDPQHPFFYDFIEGHPQFKSWIQNNLCTDSPMSGLGDDGTDPVTGDPTSSDLATQYPFVYGGSAGTPDTSIQDVVNNLQAQINDINSSPGGSSASTSVYGSTGSNTSLLNSILGDANNIAKIVLTPGGSYTITNPVTGQVTTYQGTGQATTPSTLGISSSSLSSLLPILLLGVGAFVVIEMMGKH